ncbi:MAG: hypothetical protein M3O50_07330, partial [Myxococcota bacterium]|nr:hypothetical protein [Myxococcota bacterium]
MASRGVFFYLRKITLLLGETWPRIMTIIRLSPTRGEDEEWRMRRFARWIALVAFSFTGGSAVVACGTSPDSVFPPIDAGVTLPDASGGNADANIGDDASGVITYDAPSFITGDGSGGCQPKT